METHAENIMVDPVVLPVLARAAASIGVDLETAIEGLTERFRDTEPTDSVSVVNYFKLLHRLANISHDETMAMSSRPLMAGAFHYVLEQACKLSTFEELLHHFARSFNMLHGGTYNHVLYRDDVIVYGIDVNGFPYPFKLSSREKATLLDCILILVHELFEFSVGAKLKSKLCLVRTDNPVRQSAEEFYQLNYWPCKVSCLLYTSPSPRDS